MNHEEEIESTEDTDEPFKHPDAFTRWFIETAGEGNLPDLNEGRYGSELRELVRSGKWSLGDAGRAMQGMLDHGLTWDEAQEYGPNNPKGFYTRSKYQLKESGQGLEEWIHDPAKKVSEIISGTRESVGQESDVRGNLGELALGHTGNIGGKFSGWVLDNTGSPAVATGAKLTYDVISGIIVGIPVSIGNTITMTGSVGDLLDTATVFTGIGRGVLQVVKAGKGVGKVLKIGRKLRVPGSSSIMRKAIDQSLQGKNIFISKKLVRDMLNDDIYGPLLKHTLKQIDENKVLRGLNTAELLVEIVNLAVQNEELLHELLGYAGQRVLVRAFQIKAKGGKNLDQALESASREFATRYGQPPIQEPVDEETAIEEEEEGATAASEAAKAVDEGEPDTEIIEEDIEEDIEEPVDEETAIEEEEEGATAASEAAKAVDEGEPDTEIIEEDIEEDIEEPVDEETAIEEEEEGATAEEDERERVSLERAKEFGDAFSDESVGEISEPERITIEQGVSSDTYSHYNIYQDLKNIGGVAHFRDPSGERVSYFANDPQRSKKAAQDLSQSDSVYIFQDHQWNEFDVGEAYYPTFDSLADVINYMNEKTDKEVGGVLEGSPTRTVWGSNRKAQYRVQYKLRDMRKLVTSHLPDGTENPVYPQKYQPREQRSSVISQEQIKGNAKKINPTFLIDHFSTLTDGAPILSKKLRSKGKTEPDHVIVGTARTLTILEAAENHPEEYQKYIDYLKSGVSQYGEDPALVDDMLARGEVPGLTRELLDDIDEIAFADDSNRSSMLEGTSTEQANRDATYLKDDVMVEYKGDIGQSLTDSLNSDDNLEFRQKLLQNIPTEERNAFLRSDGETISERGARRIQNMMMRYVFRGDFGIKLSEILIESGFEEIQNINNMLEAIVPNLALLESYFRHKMRDPKLSISEEMARAVATMNELAKNQENIGMFFRQDTLFGPKTPIDQLSVPALQMLYIMDHRRGAYRQLSHVFLQYVDAVLELDVAQPGLFESEFSKRDFFQHQIFRLLWDNPPEDLQRSLEAAPAAQARDIVQNYVNDLMTEIDRQAEQRGMKEDPKPPEPQPVEEEGETQEAVADEEGLSVKDQLIQNIKNRTYAQGEDLIADALRMNGIKTAHAHTLKLLYDLNAPTTYEALESLAESDSSVAGFNLKGILSVLQQAQLIEYDGDNINVVGQQEMEAVADEDVAAEEVLFEQRNPLDMTDDEIEQAEEEARVRKVNEPADALKAFEGDAEKLKRFEKGEHLKDESGKFLIHPDYDPEDFLSPKFMLDPEWAEEFGDLTPEQKDLLYGNPSDHRLDLEDWRRITRALSDAYSAIYDIQDGNTKHLMRTLAFAMMETKPENAKVAIAAQGVEIGKNLEHIANTIRIREITLALKEAGYTQESIAQGVIGYLGTQIEANDVADMLAPWFIKEESTPEPKPIEEGPIEEEPGVTDEEYEVAFKDYEYKLEQLSKLYFDSIMVNNFLDADRLPSKVEFAEQWTLTKNAPESYQKAINELLELKRTIDQYEFPHRDMEAFEPGEIEAELRKEVETSFGAHVLSVYDERVADLARIQLFRAESLKLIDYKPAETNEGFTSRTYTIGENADTFITISHDPTISPGYTVIFDIPNYEKKSVTVEKHGKFTDKQARVAINEAINKAYNDRDFVYGDNPRTSVQPLTSEQETRIDKMPPIVEETAFRDHKTGTKAGMAFSMPGLNPAMRIKTTFVGDNTYEVYIESDEHIESKNFKFQITTNTETGESYATARFIGESPLDAVQRALANLFDDTVWDTLNEDPDPQPNPLDDQGVAGNMPAPLPAQIKLKPVRTGDGMMWFNIVDDAGNTIPDYSITVDPDPLGVGDNMMEVTVRFPNHKDIDAITEMAQGVTPEEATVKAIANLMQYEIGKGGLSSPSIAQHEMSTDTLLENRPSPLKTTDKDFGKMRLDKVSMKRESLSQSGHTKIYRFGAKGTPRVKVKKLGDGDNSEWFVEVQYPRYNAASYVSYAKTGQAAVTEAIQKLEESDHEWKPLYKSGIISEIDSVQNAINRRQFATTPAVERRTRGIFTNLKRGVPVDLRGYQITSNKELVILGQIFRHPGLERHIVFFLDENFRIVGHETTSIGVPGQAVNPRSFRINYHMKRLNAMYFMHMHNHPGGPAILSDPDKASARSFLKRYPNAFLGQGVVNSGEYAESVVSGGKIRNRNSIELSEEDLGWDPHTTKRGFFRRNNNIRPGDPLYQYDVNSETGKLLQLSTDIQGSGMGGNNLNNAAKFAKYLQTEQNWTTIFFKGRNGEILDVMEYKDLHLLDAPVLWSFIESEARSRGGIYVDAFVGEGDWYKTKEDINNSVWGQVLNTTYKNSMGTDAGIQFAWFDGLSEENEYHYEYGKPLLSLQEIEMSGLVPGRLHETVADSDYGIETGLTEPSEALDAFIERIREGIGTAGTVNALKTYGEMIGEYTDAKASLIVEFVEFVGNQYLLSENVSPNTASPTDAVATYNEMYNVTRPIRNKPQSYVHARLGAITEKDRVLTIGDNTGDLATFATTAGAASVDTITTDGWTRKMFDQMLPGVATVHNIDAYNLSREWTGPRPTVILLNVLDVGKQPIDEALKLLAPNGRLVFFDPQGDQKMLQDLGERGVKKYWDTLHSRNTIRHIGWGDTKIGTIDKRKGSSEATVISVNDNDTLFAKVEEHRHARAPITESDIDAEFTGIGPGEQTFDQPISNPPLPAGMQLTGQSLSLPPTDSGAGGQSQPTESARTVSRPGMDIGIAESELRRPGIATQDNVSVSMSPVGEPAQMGMDETDMQRGGVSSIEGGEDVDTELGSRRFDEGMFVQRGQVSGQGSPRSPIESRRVVGPGGTRVTTGGISNYETGVTQHTNAIGIPVAVAVEHGAAEVPTNTPIGLSQQMRDFQTSPGYHAWGVQTGKRTMELMGEPGISIITSLMRGRNFGDILSGKGENLLDNLYLGRTGWRKFEDEYAKENNIRYKEASKELNHILTNHIQGKSKVEVPDIVDNIVRQVRGFVKERIETPALEENVMILQQGLLGEMPSDYVEKGYLEKDHRTEIDMDRRQFDTFMKSDGQRWETKGVIKGFVQDRETGKVFAVFVRQKAGVPDRQTYTLESPFGEKVKVDKDILLDQDPNYTLIATRDPHRQKWTDRDVAKDLWNSEVSAGMEDPIRDAFEEAGIPFPAGAKFNYSKKANIQQWEVIADGQPRYIIKRIVPSEENEIATPHGIFLEYNNVHSVYNEFANKLLIYKASEARDPIFIYRGKTPHKIWTPIENYFPHIIDWNRMSDDPRKRAEHKRYLEYAQKFADANQMSVVDAKSVLRTHIVEAKTRKDGNLEQDRQYIFPEYNRDFFNVMHYYINRVSHRLQIIKEFGQDNDLLKVKLNQFLSEDAVFAEMAPAELAVTKLRFLAGYRDFEKGSKSQPFPFREENGDPVEFTPEDFEMTEQDLTLQPMSPADWQALVDENILEVTSEGKYKATVNSLLFLENPLYLQGALAKGAERMKIAEDIIVAQLGWKQGDIFDEIGKEGWRNARQLFGLIYLGRAYIPNISQSVNVGIATNWRTMFRSIFSYAFSKKNREWVQADSGAYAIDALHEFGGSGAPLSRTLHHMLGATPRYGGKFSLKSLAPTHKYWQDPSVRKLPYTPFFKQERINRGIAALAGRYEAVRLLKKIVKRPKSGKVNRARLLAIPHAYDLEVKLDAALEVPNLTAQDISLVKNLNEKEVRAQAPHLFPVYEFLVEHAKGMADWTQHRVESMDRWKWMRDSPILMTSQLFRSFDHAQNKFLKDKIKKDWEIMHILMNDKGIKNKLLVKSAATVKVVPILIPNIVISAGLFGIGVNVLQRIAKLEVPDEEDLDFFAGVVQAGGASFFGNLLFDALRWGRSPEEAALGPVFGTTLDVVGDIIAGGKDVAEGNVGAGMLRLSRTLLRLARPPTINVSAWELMKSLQEEESAPVRPVNLRGGRRSTQRNRLERTPLGR